MIKCYNVNNPFEHIRPLGVKGFIIDSHYPAFTVRSRFDVLWWRHYCNSIDFYPIISMNMTVNLLSTVNTTQANVNPVL